MFWHSMGETLVSQKKKPAISTLKDVVDDFHTGGALENGCVRRDLGHRFLDPLGVQSHSMGYCKAKTE